MPRKVLAAFILLLVALSARAQNASTESIEELLTISKAESLLTSVYEDLEPALRQSMNDALAGTKLNAKQAKAVEAMPARMAQILRDELSWSTYKPLYVQLYKESLSQEEVDGLIAFYKTPAGAAMINKMPRLAQKSMAMMQQRLAPLMGKIEAVVKQTLAEAGDEP